MRAPSDKSDGGIRVPSTGPPVTVPTDGGTVVRSRLFIKYVTLFVAVVSLVLIANAVFDVYFSYQEQKASLVRIQREQAEAAAGKIGQFISEIESQVGWTTQLPWSASTLEQRRFDALRLLRQVPAITELAEIDSTGHEQLKVSRLATEVVGSFQHRTPARDLRHAPHLPAPHGRCADRVGSAAASSGRLPHRFSVRSVPEDGQRWICV
jgi:hypothetical protein